MYVGSVIRQNPIVDIVMLTKCISALWQTDTKFSKLFLGACLCKIPIYKPNLKYIDVNFDTVEGRYHRIFFFFVLSTI